MKRPLSLYDNDERNRAIIPPTVAMTSVTEGGDTVELIKKHRSHKEVDMMEKEIERRIIQHLNNFDE